MKKIYKRLSAVFLALVIVTGSVLGNGFVAQADVYKELFRDDFSSYTQSTNALKNKAMSDNGWSNLSNTKASYNTGDSYVIPLGKNTNMGTGKVGGSGEWTNYSVEAKMTFLYEEGETVSGGTQIGLIGRLQENEIDGYRLLAVRSAVTDTTVKLYLQRAYPRPTDTSKADTENLVVTDAISGISTGTAFTLRLEFNGNKIYGYLNNQLQITYDISNDSVKHNKGWAGIIKPNNNGSCVMFDDFIVSQVIEQDYPTGYLYYNDFNDEQTLIDAGIVTTATASISEGCLHIKNNERTYFSNVVDSVNWENYTVESDVMIVQPEGDERNIGYAGIVARTKNTDQEGYEYRIQYNKGTTKLQLYKRVGEEATSIPGKDYTLEDFNLNTAYKLTMSVHNNGDDAEIMCWFTDYSKPLEEQTKVIFDVVDEKTSSNSPYLTGYAGVRSAGGNDSRYLPSQYDYFGVKEYTAPTFTYPEGYLYYNDFEENFRLVNEGWRSAGTKEDGVYKLNGSAANFLTKVTDSAAWTNYVVEADVSIENTDVLPQAASIVARTVSAGQSGYEFQIRKDDTGTYLRLYKRGVDYGYINGEKYVYYDNTIDVTTDNTLKMVVNGNEIICYFNGKLIFEVIDKDNPYLAGYTGVRSQEGEAKSTYDNFAVRTIQPTDLPTNAAYPEGYFYYNDFSTRRDLSKEGFTNTGDKAGEVYTLAGSARNYLTNVEGSSDWTDYVVEADVSIVDNGELPQHASITARCDVDENRGYEYRITKEESGETCLWLYKRGSSSGKINGEICKYYMDIDVTKSHEMKMVVNGNDLICYFDGELIFEIVDKEAYTKGYAGVRSATGTAASIYDNFAVRVIEVTDLPTNDGYPEGYLYVNNFSTRRDLTKEGWETSGTKQNGLYHLTGGTGNHLTNVEGSSEWTDYVVEADVSIKDDGSATQYASITARYGKTSEGSSRGYEFRITKDNGKTSLQLYKRGVTSGAINGKKYSYDLDFDATGTHKMKMVVKGNDIICYFDGELIFEVTDEEAYAKGYAGVYSPGRTTTAISTYDNYVVREIQSTDIPADAVYEEGIMYYNDFSTNRDIVKEGWMGKATKKDGVFVLKGGSYDYLANLEGASEWTDYVVEADFMLNDDGTNQQYASIVARTTKTKDEGYEYRIYQDEKGSYVWLYKRGTDKGLINGEKYQMKVGIVPGEMNDMKMVVQGANIICYFDGMKLFDVVDEDPYLTGYTGVRSPSGTATSTYDNYTVRKIQHGDIVKDKVLTKLNEDVWFYDDFKDDTSLTDRGWNTDRVVLYDGAVAPIGRLYVDGIEDCANWTDYEVSAVVRVDIDAGLQEGYTNGKSSICARSLSSTTGYEYGIIAIPGSVPYLRLYDRATDTNLAVDKSVKITEGEHTLSMICVGNEIYCYFDGTFVFAAQSDSAAAGYAGVRASGYNTYYKNFVIKKANVVATVVKPGTATGVTSPHTGTPVAYTAMMNLTMAAFVISAIGLVVTLVYGRRRES